MKTAHCRIPGTPVSPLPLCGRRAHLPTNTLTEHLADKSDPHNVRALVPAMRIGTGAPSVETGDKETDFYFDSEESTLYVLRDVGEGILRWESIARVTITQLTNKISELETTKANKATTLAGYGITDAATKEEVEVKADKTKLEDEVERAQAAESQLTTEAENAQTAANAASEKADAANTALANKLDKTAVVAPSASATAGQAADAKAVNDALANKLDKSGGTIEGAIIAEGLAGQAVFDDGGLYATNYDGISTDYKGNAIVHEGKELLFPQYDGTLALTSDIKAAVKDKADRASLAPEYSPSAAYPVGSIVYHDGNIYQCTTAIVEGGEAWTAAHWELMKLSDFFTESNSLLVSTIAAKLPYSLVTGGEIQDRAVNKIVADGTSLTLSPPSTIAGKIRDFVLRIDCTATTTIDWSAFGNCETTGGKSWSDMMLVEPGKRYIYRFTGMGGDNLCAAREEIS